VLKQYSIFLLKNSQDYLVRKLDGLKLVNQFEGGYTFSCFGYAYDPKSAFLMDFNNLIL
jgi:hypothetical protein